jgi:hypothetical protein
MPGCKFVGCKVKNAIFNFIGNIIGLYCATHKEYGMIDVKSKKCEFEGCTKVPNFNLPDQKTGKYCKIHKEDDMIDIKNKQCEFEGCTKQPAFNLPDEKQAKYCSDHKEKDMIDVRHKQCEYDGCTKNPVFNLPDETTGKYCVTHKEDNMINVINKKCEFEGCTKQPSFNLPAEKTGKYCFTHKEDKMIDIKHKRCIYCCDTRVSNPKYEGYCLYCFMNLFPDKPIVRNYKIKEKHVADYLYTYFKKFIESYDKKIKGGCSKKRPDFLINLFTHCIIIEVDENQHPNYSCENERIMLIFQDLGNRPLVLLRFNPDKYIDENGKVVDSCFKYHKTTGVCMIDDKVMWKNRLEALKEAIEKNINNIPTKEVTVEQLFYDKI